MKISSCVTKRFEPLFIGFRGIDVETNYYIGIGAVKALSLKRIGESIDRPVC